MRLFLAAAVLFAGCTDLEEFRGTFSGVIVGGVDMDDPDCMDPEGCSFIRRGFPSGMTLELADFVPPPSEAAIGTLQTTGYEGGTMNQEAFAGDEQLQLIPVLEHDQLSLYDFPGAARVRNYIFAAESNTDGALAGETVMVFMSLIGSDEIEVRLLAGVNPDEQHFGLFRMKRQ